MVGNNYLNNIDLSLVTSWIKKFSVSKSWFQFFPFYVLPYIHYYKNNARHRSFHRNTKNVHIGMNGYIVGITQVYLEWNQYPGARSQYKTYPHTTDCVYQFFPGEILVSRNAPWQRCYPEVYRWSGTKRTQVMYVFLIFGDLVSSQSTTGRKSFLGRGSKSHFF